MTTYSEMLSRWHELADGVESIANDDERRAVCAEMDDINAKMTRIDREIDAHDDGVNYRRDVETDMRA